VTLAGPEIGVTCADCSTNELLRLSSVWIGGPDRRTSDLRDEEAGLS
jgi:hypothetical protein